LVHKSRSKIIKTCQICSSKKLENHIFLGFYPAVNFLTKISDYHNENIFFPLELIRCKKCGLIQNRIEVSKEIMFPKSYPYLSGSTNVLKKNFEDLCSEVLSMNVLKKNEMVLDIGCNDGSLLENLCNKDFNLVGIEPTNSYKIAKKKGINCINSFFDKNCAIKIKKKYGFAKIIFATNVFAHVSDSNKFLKNISYLMSHNTIMVIEIHYLSSMLKKLQFDKITHEHLRYYHLITLDNHLKNFGINIFQVQKIPSHGGSLRLFTSKKKYKTDHSIRKIKEEEIKLGIHDGSSLKKFKTDIIAIKYSLLNLLGNLKKKNLRIFGVGAPTRAITLLNFVGIDESYIDCILEMSNSKRLNHFMPGTNIKIKDEEIAFKMPPDYLLILSWHISEVIIKNFKKRGYRGKFIVPLPKPKVVI